MVTASAQATITCLCFLTGPKLNSVSELESMNRFMEPPLTGSFCDLLWADPLLEDVLGYKLSDRDFSDVSRVDK